MHHDPGPRNPPEAENHKGIPSTFGRLGRSAPAQNSHHLFCGPYLSAVEIGKSQSFKSCAPGSTGTTFDRGSSIWPRASTHLSKRVYRSDWSWHDSCKTYPAPRPFPEAPTRTDPFESPNFQSTYFISESAGASQLGLGLRLFRQLLHLRHGPKTLKS